MNKERTTIAFAPHVREAVGIDVTPAMLERARKLAADKGLPNVAWRQGDVYALPYQDASFTIVTTRFSFHHFLDAAAVLREMVRVCAPGGRIVVVDDYASEDPAKAAAFNRMERHRDPSTVAFRSLPFLVDLFTKAGFPPPAIVRFQVAYQRDVLIAKSFPANDERDALRQMIDELIDSDAMETGTAPGGTAFIYPTAVLTATRP